jgi:hypothetical protein
MTWEEAIAAVESGNVNVYAPAASAEARGAAALDRDTKRCVRCTRLAKLDDESRCYGCHQRESRPDLPPELAHLADESGPRIEWLRERFKETRREEESARRMLGSVILLCLITVGCVAVWALSVVLA